jgi:ribonuclease HI
MARRWPNATYQEDAAATAPYAQRIFDPARWRADEPLRVLCDSQYVINSVTQWMPGWKRRGWRKADGKPVLNRELLEQLDAALAGRDVKFEWVKGHAGHPLNEAADLRARSAATAFQAGRSPDHGPGLADVASAPSVEVSLEQPAAPPTLF